MSNMNNQISTNRQPKPNPSAEAMDDFKQQAETERTTMLSDINALNAKGRILNSGSNETLTDNGDETGASERRAQRRRLGIGGVAAAAAIGITGLLTAGGSAETPAETAPVPGEQVDVAEGPQGEMIQLDDQRVAGTAQDRLQDGLKVGGDTNADGYVDDVKLDADH